MTQRPRLTFAGGDVELVSRLPDGRALAAYVDRDGKRTPFTATAWPHEFRGVGWHLAEIKRLIGVLPLQGSAPVAPTLLPSSETVAPRPRGFLHAHFAADRED